MPERVLALSQQVSSLATSRVDEIRRITRMTRLLAMNAAIEAARVGQAGAGFAVVSDEVGSISERIDRLAEQLNEELTARVAELNTLGKGLIANIRGTRLADLALNMIDIIDRNLYERSCDVRWWATDSAVVDCTKVPSPEACAHASDRLGIILDSYTVYLDLWVANKEGRIIANGRPRLYPEVRGLNVAGEAWFRQAISTRDGTEFVACDIERSAALGGAHVAAYSTAIRESGSTNGAVTGVLGIFFDWEKQSQTVVNNVRLTDDEKARTRCLIVNARHQAIAASDGMGLFETCPIETNGQAMGTYLDREGNLVGFALTPGYETYKGLGWYGVLIQRRV